MKVTYPFRLSSSGKVYLRELTQEVLVEGVFEVFECKGVLQDLTIDISCILSLGERHTRRLRPSAVCSVVQRERSGQGR